MSSGGDSLPDNIEVLQMALIAARAECAAEAARAVQIEAELAVARAKASDDQALIAHQKLQIEKLRRQLYGSRSERASRLLDQTELQFEELESSATEDEIAAQKAVAKTTTVAGFTRKRPARQPFPGTCRANASSCRDRQHALAAAARGCARWARRSPRRWNRSRVNGR
jgi:transposase